MFQNPAVQGACMSLLAFGVYAFADVTIKFMGLGFSAVQIIFCAALFSMPCILLQAILSPGRLSLRPKLLGWTLVRVVLIVTNSVIVSYTFTKLPLAQAYAIFFCMPLFVTLLAVPFLGEPLDTPRMLAVLAGFCGVLIALHPSSIPLQFAHLTALTGATLGALNSILLRKIGSRERPSVVLLYPAMAQVLFLALFLPWLWQPMAAFDWSLAALIGVLSAVGGLLIIAAYTRASAIVVAPMQYSQIIWGALCGALIFHEKMDALMALGIAVIIAAGLYLLWNSGHPVLKPPGKI